MLPVAPQAVASVQVVVDGGTMEAQYVESSCCAAVQDEQLEHVKTCPSLVSYEICAHAPDPFVVVHSFDVTPVSPQGDEVEHVVPPLPPSSPGEAS